MNLYEISIYIPFWGMIMTYFALRYIQLFAMWEKEYLRKFKVWLILISITYSVTTIVLALGMDEPVLQSVLVKNDWHFWVLIVLMPSASLLKPQRAKRYIKYLIASVFFYISYLAVSGWYEYLALLFYVVSISSAYLILSWLLFFGDISQYSEVNKNPEKHRLEQKQINMYAYHIRRKLLSQSFKVSEEEIYKMASRKKFKRDVVKLTLLLGLVNLIFLGFAFF